ncbi:hypothetical protein M9H77_05659 [Catharanthus roseus]|uniref:Uncharacterized protein n=1 Tax=Catharanthus roseus TaxID=4058 RepID=A0ACC0CI49_CATRO|nr:hypothetical protein M9H77_05659 [Catharanthus roseus]
MRRDEKRQRFHEALLQMLYPPPTTATPKQDQHESVDTLSGGLNLDEFPGDEPKKLTRAQRKRLRKKKLKEAASTHRKFIGPTLPCEANGNVAGEGPPCVRQNASNKPGSEEAPTCSKRNKQKHRRIAKKLASGRLESSKP